MHARRLLLSTLRNKTCLCRFNGHVVNRSRRLERTKSLLATSRIEEEFSPKHSIDQSARLDKPHDGQETTSVVPKSVSKTITRLSNEEKRQTLQEAVSALRAASSNGTAGIAEYNKLFKEMLDFKNRLPLFMNEAFLLLETMADANIEPNEDTFTTLSMMCFNARDFLRLSNLHTFMEEQGHEVSERLRNIYIQTLLSARHVERAQDEIKSLNKRGMALNLTTYTMLCEQYVISADMDVLLGIVDDMEAAYPSASAQLCMDLLIKAIEVEHLSAVTKLWEIVVDRYNVNVGIGMVTMVLQCTARLGDPAFARMLMSKLNELNVQLTEEHLIPFMEACVGGGEISAALKTLCLLSQTASPKLKHLSFLSEAISKDSATVDNAFFALQEIRNAGEVKVNTTAVNVIIEASGLLHDIERTISTYNDMSIFSCAPNSETFESLMLLCLNENQIELANKFLAEMTELGLQKSRTTYDRLIRLHLKSEDYELVFPILEEMKAAGHKPSESLYEALVLKCAQRNDGRAAVAAQEMREAGYFDGRVNSMIGRRLDYSYDPDFVPSFRK